MKHFTLSEACVCVCEANFSMSLFCFLAASCTQQLPSDATVLVVAHRTPRSTTRCGVSVRAVRAVYAVRCFGSRGARGARGAVFRDAGGARCARCVRCGLS